MDGDEISHKKFIYFVPKATSRKCRIKWIDGVDTNDTIYVYVELYHFHFNVVDSVVILWHTI
jgi:hypothetical protein